MINSIQQFQENGIGKIEKVTSKFIPQEEKSLKKKQNTYTLMLMKTMCHYNLKKQRGL